ncbi:MAG: ComF family protein [Chloroflexaceae bacterium]|jgi:ComF family protein|nr:ComF family protein [Chloroflexaceae bacterium]
MLASLTDSLLSLLFPDRCAGCQRMGSLFCAGCQAALRPYPPDRTPPQLDAAAVAFVFGGPLRAAIHELKYKKVRRMARPLGELLAGHLRHAPLPADGLLAVPLHAVRRAERGFNQSEELARRLSESLGLPLLTGLVRVRNTASQATQSDVRARHDNVRDAFVWQGQVPPPARMLLVDDVLTTGATLGACAQALRAAGAREVRAIALARSRPDE